MKNNKNRIVRYNTAYLKAIELVCCLCVISQEDLAKKIILHNQDRKELTFNLLRGLTKEIQMVDPQGGKTIQQIKPFFQGETIVSLFDCITGSNHKEWQSIS